MKKYGLLVWPMAALIGSLLIATMAPSHATSPLSARGTATSLLPS